jgi:hypothetical protein
VSDERARAVAREVATGAAPEKRIVVERMRTIEATTHFVQLAAYCGHADAKEILGCCVTGNLVGKTCHTTGMSLLATCPARRLLRSWTHGFADHFGAEAMMVVCVNITDVYVALVALETEARVTTMRPMSDWEATGMWAALRVAERWHLHAITMLNHWRTNLTRFHGLPPSGMNNDDNMVRVIEVLDALTMHATASRWTSSLKRDTIDHFVRMVVSTSDRLNNIFGGVSPEAQRPVSSPPGTSVLPMGLPLGRSLKLEDQDPWMWGVQKRVAAWAWDVALGKVDEAPHGVGRR